jgi:hypothetical protein
MTKPKININLKATEDEREELRILAAKARMSVSEFIRTLISNYGEALVRQKRQGSFVEESGLPDPDGTDTDYWDSEKEAEPEMYQLPPRLFWLTDGDELFDSRIMTWDEFRTAQDAQMALDNDYWWMQSDDEPDLPRGYGFPRYELHGSKFHIS